MAVRTRLTWMQEKNLQTYFGGKQFTLLYKASVHEFSAYDLFKRCCDQGPIVVVIYKEHYVVGAYMKTSCKKEEKVPIVLFALEENTISECKISSYVPTELFYDGSGRRNDLEFHINMRKQVMTLNLDTSEKLRLPHMQASPFQECEVFRCEDLLDRRTLEGINELHESLLLAVNTYKPHKNLVPQVRILLLGPTRAGKSSFFNSVKSVFRGHVTHQALVGSEATGVSDTYRTYSIKDTVDGNFLPFILCDTMGLHERGKGLCVDDIAYILKGHISDRYQFNSMKPITPSHCNYIHYPLLKDRIHCAAFVLDVNSVKYISHEMIAKIKEIRRQLIKCGMPHVVLLTHVDSMRLITKGDLTDIYRCIPVKHKLEAVHKKLGFALSDMLVVSNYTSEWELDPIKDVLILSALRHMLWISDDFLEDLTARGNKNLVV
ncbi:interferon-induced protein 44 [Felis catus]|uniref:TLDc domain-containing protein n=1 Tax=Felis catus TaxID=9685 RepID=A0ABI7XJS9_FELCA|nr:interferon-induced protein 44 [Felis catus]XP_044891999.1 interferon-induced protein 44 [Felis catus]